MADIQNHGQTVGRVTTTFNGEKIQVDVYEDRCVILPDGTVRKVKQEVVDTLIAKNRVMNPTHASQEEPMSAPAPEPPQQYAEPTAPEQEEYQQPQEPAGQPNVQQFINQLHTPAAPAPQPVEQPVQQEAVPSQPESQQAQPAAPVPEQKPKKSFFSKEKKEKPKKEKKKKEKAQAPAPTPAPIPEPTPQPMPASPQAAPAVQPLLRLPKRRSLRLA